MSLLSMPDEDLLTNYTPFVSSALKTNSGRHQGVFNSLKHTRDIWRVRMYNNKDAIFEIFATNIMKWLLL